MAKIVEERVTVKFSRLVRNNEDVEGTLSAEHLQLIDATLQEVLDLPAGVVVEVEADE